MPGSSRYESQFFPTVQKLFSKAEMKRFDNPLTFESVEPFVSYTRASLSEDRKLWGSFFQGKDDFVKIMQDIEKVAADYLKRDGKLVMTKVVGGILGTK